MIGGLSLWVPNEAVGKGSSEVHDHVEPINLRVSPPPRPQTIEPPGFRMDGISLSPEGERLAAAQTAAAPAIPEIDVPSLKVSNHSTDHHLAARDRAVRAHESAHRAHAGRYAGAPTYTFERGSDGRIYIAGGQLSIDMQPVPNNPAATVQKMQVLERAALAPANSSSADRAVANLARGEGARARRQVQLEAQREQALEQIRERQREERAATEEELYGGGSAYPVSFNRIEFTGGLQTGIETAAGRLEAGGLATAGVGTQQAGTSSLAASLTGELGED